MPRLDWTALAALVVFVVAVVAMFAILIGQHGCAEIMGNC